MYWYIATSSYRITSYKTFEMPVIPLYINKNIRIPLLSSYKAMETSEKEIIIELGDVVV